MMTLVLCLTLKHHYSVRNLFPNVNPLFPSLFGCELLLRCLMYLTESKNCLIILFCTVLYPFLFADRFYQN